MKGSTRFLLEPSQVDEHQERRTPRKFVDWSLLESGREMSWNDSMRLMSEQKVSRLILCCFVGRILTHQHKLSSGSGAWQPSKNRLDSR